MDDLVSTQPITEDDLKKIREFVKDSDNIEYTEEDIANIMISETEAEKQYRQKKLRDLKLNDSRGSSIGIRSGSSNIYNISINSEDNEILYDDNGEILVKTQRMEEPLNELPYGDIISRTNSDLFTNISKNKILGLNTITSNLEDSSFSPEKLKNECFFDIPQNLNGSNNNNSNSNSNNNNSINNNNNSFNNNNNNSFNNNNNNSFDSILSSPNNIKRINTVNLNDSNNNNNNNNNNTSLNNSLGNISNTSSSSITVSPTKQLEKLNELNQFLSMTINDITASSITPIKRASTATIFNSFSYRHKSDMLEYQYSQTDYQSMLDDSCNEMLPPPPLFTSTPTPSTKTHHQEDSVDQQMNDNDNEDDIITSD